MAAQQLGALPGQRDMTLLVVVRVGTTLHVLAVHLSLRKAAAAFALLLHSNGLDGRSVPLGSWLACSSELAR